MDNLSERVAWAIETIKSDTALDRNITDEALAAKLGTNKNTIGDYRRKKGLIKGIVLERLASAYGFNPGWLLEGKGEPFSGACMRYPEIRGAASETQASAAVHEKKNSYSTPKQGQVAGQSVKTSESVRMVIEVLESGSPYAGLLQCYIQNFYLSIEVDARMTRIEDEQNKTKSLIESARKEIQSMEENMRAELNRGLSEVRMKLEEVRTFKKM